MIVKGPWSTSSYPSCVYRCSSGRKIVHLAVVEMQSLSLKDFIVRSVLRPLGTMKLNSISKPHPGSSLGSLDCQEKPEMVGLLSIPELVLGGPTNFEPMLASDGTTGTEGTRWPLGGSGADPAREDPECTAWRGGGTPALVQGGGTSAFMLWACGSCGTTEPALRAEGDSIGSPCGVRKASAVKQLAPF